MPDNGRLMSLSIFGRLWRLAHVLISGKEARIFRYHLHDIQPLASPLDIQSSASDSKITIIQS